MKGESAEGAARDRLAETRAAGREDWAGNERETRAEGRRNERAPGEDGETMNRKRAELKREHVGDAHMKAQIEGKPQRRTQTSALETVTGRDPVAGELRVGDLGIAWIVENVVSMNRTKDSRYTTYDRPLGHSWMRMKCAYWAPTADRGRVPRIRRIIKLVHS